MLPFDEVAGTPISAGVANRERLNDAIVRSVCNYTRNLLSFLVAAQTCTADVRYLIGSGGCKRTNR